MPEYGVDLDLVREWREESAAHLGRSMSTNHVERLFEQELERRDARIVELCDALLEDDIKLVGGI